MGTVSSCEQDAGNEADISVGREELRAVCSGCLSSCRDF